MILQKPKRIIQTEKELYFDMYGACPYSMYIAEFQRVVCAQLLIQKKNQWVNQKINYQTMNEAQTKQKYTLSTKTKMKRNDGPH